MTTLTQKAASDYLSLIRRHPLLAIRSEDDLDAAHEALRPLIVHGTKALSAGEREYRDALAALIHEYERARHAISPDKRTPAQRLRYLMRESRTTESELAKVLGVSQSMVSHLLTGRRELTVANIRKLAAYFKLGTGHFI